MSVCGGGGAAGGGVGESTRGIMNHASCSGMKVS